jgi:DNA-directed RNA polymerase specialized sigma24 family protein
MPFRWRRDNKPRHEPTAAERAAFDEMLLGQDLESAEVQAYDYAFRLTRRNPAMAKQLVLQARTRLWERCTFDPKKAPLGAFLCGVVRSVWSTEARRAVTQREREVEYLTEVDTLEGSNAKSPEDLHVARDESTEARDEAARELDELRAHFVDTGDEVNLLWLQYSLDGIDDLPEMVAKSGRKVEEFYRARDRRVRYVKRRRENPPEKT